MAKNRIRTLLSSKHTFQNHKAAAFIYNVTVYS